MKRSIEQRIDVTEAAALGHAAHTAVTVFLPRIAVAPAVVCFMFPGGGFSRHYYAMDADDRSAGGQAGFHTERGWIVVACDHLGFGDSTIPETNIPGFEAIGRANHAMVAAIMQMLAGGTLTPDFAPVHNAVTLGVGQSMGGCFTIVAQGQLRTFDAVAILGYSAIHTVVPSPPGVTAVWPWVVRGSDLNDPVILNRESERVFISAPEMLEAFKWSFHQDAEPAEMRALDLAALSGSAKELPIWRSASTPACAAYMLAPGAVALEAASISVPVFIGVGERDVVPDLWAEPKAFRRASDITLFLCPRMAHMHNFAHTRTWFWQKLHSWGTGVTALQEWV